jgi:energy-coupling factor transporter ATP-binding protein EcfA2
VITFDHLSYTYPGAARPALQDISLRVDEGAFALLMGPSGAGKSTLLRAINGLVPHFSGGRYEGRVVVDGLEPVRAAPQTMSRHVGFVFQNPEAQFVVDRVEDEIAFALENAALPRQEMRVRVEETLDLLDLAPLRDRPLATLSGGEQQRVAIAAALALRPRILVLDEPTSQLDPKSAEDVLKSLVRLNEDLGLTVVLSEHRLERVLRYCDQLISLAEDGTLAAAGDPEEVLDQVALTPPLVTVAKALDWRPRPLTVKDGRRFARRVETPPRRSAPAPARPARDSDGAALRIEDLRFSYGGVRALDGVSLRVARGELVALMGRNGAGKSTLFNCVVGLLRPERGRIEVDGRSVADEETADICRRVGYLPQNPDALLFADSVREELLVTLENHGLAESAAPVPLEELLGTLGLGAERDAYPRDLSVGQRQRVALGAVTVTKPGLLLLDEPTRGLDYPAKRALVGLLRRWQAAGMAVVLSTHDVELAAQAADRVVILSQGEVIAEGDPATVLGASPLFAPQVARLFPETGWLTAEEALAWLGVKNRIYRI